MKRRLPLALSVATIAFGLMLSEARVPSRPLPRRPIPAQIQEEIARRPTARPVSFDEPDAARHYYVNKRVPEDEDVDVRALYRRARQQVGQMPRYSSGWGRYVQSGADTEGTLGRALAAGDPGTVAASEAMAGAFGTWTPLGPGNVGGRTRVLLIDPRDDRLMIAAGVSGGIWKTTNGASTWFPVAEDMVNIAVNSMARSPVDLEVLYAGTGEGYFREDVRGTSLPLRGAGIFTSTDNGDSWGRLESTDTSDFLWVNDIVFSPHTGQRIYAATRTGVWRTEDAGESWSRILNPKVKGGCLDLEMRSDRAGDTLFASCGTLAQATVYRTTNAEAAASWQAVLSDAGMSRTTIALAPSSQDIVYALAASNRRGPGGNYEQGLHAVFRSVSGGDPGTWVARTRNTSEQKVYTLLLTNPVIAMLEECGFSGTNSFTNMGWYVNTLAVDPVDPNIVWAAGVDWFRSSDGGQSWGVASYWWDERFPSFAHADQHVMVFHPDYNGSTNQTVYVGNDGGVYRTDNARAATATGLFGPCSGVNSSVAWIPLNRSYGVTQFYHGVVFPNGSKYFGGTQDNGTILGSAGAGSNGWKKIFGGDGSYSALDPTNTQVLYVQSQWANVRKSVDGGKNFFSARGGLPPAGGNILRPGDNWVFITPLAMDPSNSQRLWIGGRQLWRTDDGASLWVAASAPFKGKDQVTAIAISPHDSDTVIAGTDDGRIYRTGRGTSSTGATKFKSKKPRKGWVSWITFDPSDPGVVYATYATFGGKHVFRSTNGGQRWTPIDGKGPDALPGIPVHSVVVHPDDASRIYVATDLGIFVSTSGGESWAVENTGFGNIVTEALVAHRGGKRMRLFAFTHGRGAWRVKVSKK